MPLIISPKTTKHVMDAFSNKLELQKIPASKARFWHGNFNDAFYEGLGGLTKVIFTGYSGAVAGQALIEYASQYLKEDMQPEVYFVGSVFAFRDSCLELGDIAYAADTYSPDSFEQSIYRNAKGRGVTDVTKPDVQLLDRIIRISGQNRTRMLPCKVYCRISPGYMPDFARPSQLMDDAMWWGKSLAKIGNDDCDSGEYESASVLACSRLFGMPAVALMDVKDKRYSETDYRIASYGQKMRALDSILDIIKESVLKPG